MIRNLISASVLTATTFLAAAGLAQPPRNPPPNRSAPQPGGTSAAASPATSSSKFLAIPGMPSLSMTSVQRDIALTPDQKQQLKAISDSYLGSMQQLSKSFSQLQPEEKQQQGKDFSDRAMQAARNAQRKAESLLNPQQLATVRSVAFQLSATGMLADVSLQDKIGLSAEQKQRLNRVFEQAGEKMQQLQRDTAQQTMQLLSEEQAASLKEQINSQKQQ